MATIEYRIAEYMTFLRAFESIVSGLCGQESHTALLVGGQASIFSGTAKVAVGREGADLTPTQSPDVWGCQLS